MDWVKSEIRKHEDSHLPVSAILTLNFLSQKDKHDIESQVCPQLNIQAEMIGKFERTFEVILSGMHKIKMEWESDPAQSNPTFFITRSSYKFSLISLAVEEYIRRLTNRVPKSIGSYQHFLRSPVNCMRFSNIAWFSAALFMIRDN